MCKHLLQFWTVYTTIDYIFALHDLSFPSLCEETQKLYPELAREITGTQSSTSE